MRILVSNDDGIYSQGINFLVNALKEIGDVTVVAPLYEQSAVGQLSYEVGAEVATQFPKKYLVNKRVSFFLDLTQINYDFMTEFGIPKNNIQKSELCSYSMKNFLHSYRRGGLHSGRALGLIFLKG